MAYEMVMPYHLHMPSYFLETFTEYPFLSVLGRRRLETVCGVCVFQFLFTLSVYFFDKMACRIEFDTVEVLWPKIIRMPVTSFF